MSRHAIAFWLALAAPGLAQPVRIGVFGLFRPTELRLGAARGGALIVRAGQDRFVLEDGATAALSLRNGWIECRWRGGTLRSHEIAATPRGSGGVVLSVPAKVQRRFVGDVEVTAAGGRLVPIVRMDLEVAVASATAAESPPDAPLEGLKAQAVVARSNYVARPRHAQFDFCDTTHCQFLREPPGAREPASLAALATRGLVLAWNGAPLAALYSASCGGRTRASPSPCPAPTPISR